MFLKYLAITCWELDIAASVEKRQMVFVSVDLKSGGEGRHPWTITVMCGRLRGYLVTGLNLVQKFGKAKK